MEAITAHLPAMEAPAAEPSLGIGARIGNTLRNGYDAISDRLESMKDRTTALIALGGIAFVGAQASELAINVDPVAAAENVPALAGTSLLLGATASEVSQQDCVNEALVRPAITNTQMKHAGVSGTQESYAYIENQAVGQEPDGSDCSAAGVLRVEKFMFRTQDPKHRARTVPYEPGFLMFNMGNDAGKYTVALGVGSKDKGLYACTPGPKKTKAEVDIMLAAMDTHSHKALAKRIYKAPIKKIFPKAC